MVDFDSRLIDVPKASGESRPRDELVGGVRDRPRGDRAHHRARSAIALYALGGFAIVLFAIITAIGVFLCFCLAEMAATWPERSGGLPSYAFETFKPIGNSVLAAHGRPLVVGVLARLVHGCPDQRVPRLALHRRPLQHRLRRRVRADQLQVRRGRSRRRVRRRRDPAARHVHPVLARDPARRDVRDRPRHPARSSRSSCSASFRSSSPARSTASATSRSRSPPRRSAPRAAGS